MIARHLRPVPRWVQGWALLTVLLTVVLLAFGGFVTAFKVGMADPVWPTEPWYLLNNTDWAFGFVVEHTHRLAGWIVGGAVTVLALAVWWTEPDRRLKVWGFAAIIALLMTYGEFHRGMGQAWAEVKVLALTERNLDSKSETFSEDVGKYKLFDKVKNWPTTAGGLTLVCALAAIACGVLAGLSGAPGGWLRTVAVIGLVAIMLQGLLGGFRVFFHALAGPSIAALHGAFGQIAFCVLVAVAVLATPRRHGDSLPEKDAEYFSQMAWGLVFLLGLQLVWAVRVSHGGSGTMQKLHILTAFAIVGMIVTMLQQILYRGEVRALVGHVIIVLNALLILQVILGVEAYLGKFAANGPEYFKLPTDRRITKHQAVVRTAHQLIGCGLLACSVVLAIRVSRSPATNVYVAGDVPTDVPPVAAMAFDIRPESAEESRAPDFARIAMDPPPDGMIR